MSINILIVADDLTTVVSIGIGDIESNNDFFYFQDKARELHLDLTATIDAWGATIINRLQLEPLQKEIETLRRDPKINKEILEVLQRAIDAARKAPRLYILFFGD